MWCGGRSSPRTIVSIIQTQLCHGGELGRMTIRMMVPATPTVAAACTDAYLMTDAIFKIQPQYRSAVTAMDIRETTR